MSAKLIAQYVHKFKSMQGLDVRLYNNGAAAEFDLPGFVYGDFDRLGNIPVWTIGKYFEIMRVIPYWQPKFFYSGGTTGTSTAVLHSQTYNISQEFYNRASFKFSITLSVKAGYLGKSRYTLNMNLICKQTKQNLVENNRQIIYIDNETRKATEVPKSLAHHFTNVTTPPFHVSSDEAPAGAFMVKRGVEFSDYDHLQHVNTHSYARWCLDAAARAAHAQALTQFKHDFAAHKLKRLEMLHILEAFVPDVVSIKVWECPTQKRTLLFEIHKTINGEVKKIYFSRMQFYPLEIDSKTAKL